MTTPEQQAAAKAAYYDATLNQAVQILYKSDDSYAALRALADTLPPTQAAELRAWAILAEPAEADAIRDIQTARYHGALTEYERLLLESIPPPTEEVVWEDPLTSFRSDLWKKYSPSNGMLTWGQNGNRSGFYTGDGYTYDSSGLTMQVLPDPQGRIAESGAPGWETQYLITRGVSTPSPRCAKWYIEARFDKVAGFWPCPLWLLAVPGGFSNMEVDGPELFTNDGNVIHLAMHGAFIGQSGTVMNLGPKFAGVPQRHVIPNMTGWHAYSIETIENGDGGLIIAWEIDGAEVQRIDTAAIEAGAGKQLKVRTITGWDTDICTQTGGGDRVMTDINGAKMQVRNFRCTRRL